MEQHPQNKHKKTQKLTIKDKEAALKHRQKTLAISLFLFVLLIFAATMAQLST